MNITPLPMAVTPFRNWFFQAIVATMVLAAIALLPRRAAAHTLPDSLVQRVDSLFAQWNKPGVPGCAVGVYRDDTLVFARGYGIADLEHSLPITPGSVFDIGSMSKQFTAACIVLLAQQGKLSLDDDIRRYLPEMPDYGARITIRHLLTHTSGLRDYLGLLAMAGYGMDDVSTDADALRLVALQKGLDFPTGTDFQYSNTGYFLASVIVKRVSGVSIRQFARQHIFTPLGMEHTDFVDDHTAIVPNRAIGYSAREDGTIRRDVSNWEQNGDGGVMTTVEDLLAWDRNFYNPTVGGSALVNALQQPAALSNGQMIQYGLGLFHDTLGGVPVVEHGGAFGGYRSQITRVPSEHLTVVVLGNDGDMNPTRLANRVLRVLLPHRIAAPTNAAPAQPAAAVAVPIADAAFDALAGDYRLEEAPDLVMTFRRSGGRYYAQLTGQPPVELTPTSDSTFTLVSVNASLTFQRGAGGRFDRLVLHQGGDHQATRIKPTVVTAKQLALYAGRYYSPELETTITVKLVNDSLMAVHPRYGAANLSPISGGEPGAFQGDREFMPQAAFEQAGRGKAASAMLLSLGRSRSIRFERAK